METVPKILVWFLLLAMALAVTWRARAWARTRVGTHAHPLTIRETDPNDSYTC